MTLQRSWLAAALLLSACSTMSSAPISVSSRHFGTSQGGRPATVWTLRNGSAEVDVTDYGAAIVAVRVPDRAGFVGDVALGFDDVSGYESDRNQYFGCTTGRVCNRIANGTFTLDSYDYVLATNNGDHHLHGGEQNSFDKVFWHAEPLPDRNAEAGVRFTYLSRDGEEGYPGNLHATVTYTLLAAGRLQIDYEARCDKRTLVNLTNHTYWNLAGEGSDSVLDHTLQVDAARYTPTDESLIPTGQLAPVVGTPFDLREGQQLEIVVGQLTATAAGGLDHNLVLDAAEARAPNDSSSRGGEGLRQVAVLRHQPTGRSMTIETTEPGLQVYSGNFLRGDAGKGGKPYPQHSAVCLETQHFPDAIHQPRFPSIVLEPGERFASTTRMTFEAH
ncbi:MAG: aldose epimerase family protein [Planctomycetota bacterium]